jgi:thiamine-monophosphate kinase
MESQFIAWLRSRLGEHAALRLGPGDDAAVVRMGDGHECVVTTDLLTDGVDFDLAGDAASRVGRKALAVNLSDLAAMAARPVAAVIAVALPRQNGLAIAQELYEGLLPLADRYGVAIAGGDTNTWDAPLAIAITLFGTPGPSGPLVRSGARPGDRILVTGEFGGSILGRHFDFEPRVDEALLLAGRYPLHAGIDVSDGLSLDLSRLAAASDCGALVRLDQIPVAQAAVELASQRTDGLTPLDHALGDGEDFELILAVPASAAERMLTEQPLGVRLTCIGEFVPEHGLWEQLPDGERRKLEPRGWEHQME